jgi:hypothetical protein
MGFITFDSWIQSKKKMILKLPIMKKLIKRVLQANKQQYKLKLNQN